MRGCPQNTWQGLSLGGSYTVGWGGLASQGPPHSCPPALPSTESEQMPIPVQFLLQVSLFQGSTSCPKLLGNVRVFILIQTSPGSICLPRTTRPRGRSQLCFCFPRRCRVGRSCVDSLGRSSFAKKCSSSSVIAQGEKEPAGAAPWMCCGPR